MYTNTDLSRGFDVFRGSRLIGHYATYEEAWAVASAGPGRWVRYWGNKP